MGGLPDLGTIEVISTGDDSIVTFDDVWNGVRGILGDIDLNYWKRPFHSFSGFRCIKGNEFMIYSKYD
jgi:hypothetical protein